MFSTKTDDFFSVFCQIFVRVIYFW